MKLALPIRGVSSVMPESLRRADTTRDMLNMRGVDPITKKYRLAQRPGLVKQLADALPGPVRAMKALTFPRKNVQYTDKTSSASAPLGTADVAASVTTGSAQPVSGIDTDKQGNVYAIDGLAGIVKYNSALELQWKQALPVKQETATVRALRVSSLVGVSDGDSEVVFAGVSAGGVQKDAGLWAYKQISTRDEEGKVETKTELLWELFPDAYTEIVRVRNGLLYAAQNEPDKGQAWVRVYFGLLARPDLAFEFEVPYPINGLDVRDTDGKILTAHAPNTTRGRDPRHPNFTARDLAKEWTIHDLTDLDLRLWADFDAATIGDELGLEDGDPVTIWPDGGKAFRALTQGTLLEQPIYYKNGPGGRPTIRFNGVDTSTLGVSPNLESASNPAVAAQFDDQQKTTLPAFFGCSWVMFMVVRLPLESAVRPIFFQDNDDPAGALAGTDQLLANKTAITAVANADPFSGKMTWLTTTDPATGEGAGLGAGGGGQNIPFSMDWPYSKSTGTAIVTIISDGHNNSTTDAAQHSIIRINGRPIDRYVSAKQSGLKPSFLGTGSFAAFLQGDVSRLLVLREYAAGGAHGSPATGGLDGAGTSHYPHAIGTFGSAAKAFAVNSTNRYNDNEIERIEGALAGEYGISHVLPCGTASVLSATANYAAGETVTIGTRTYTFVNPLTGGATEVLLDAGAGLTKANTARLMRAINGTGSPGVDYDQEMVPHAKARATCLNDQDTTTAKLKVETQDETALACTETCANASWSNNPTAAVATVTTSAILYMPGHYPHPFSLSYGYPRKDTTSSVGLLLESKGRMLASQEGILALWDANGKIAWVVTSRDAVTYGGTVTLPASNEHHGGIGWDCAFAPAIEGETRKIIYSTGPQFSPSPTTASEVCMLRRILDNTTSAAITGNGTWTLDEMTMVGSVTNQSMTSARNRIAVDTFSNVYLPFYEITPANTSIMSLVCASTIKVAGVDTANIAWTWRKSNTSANPAGVCVAIDKKLPEYDGDPATRAFAVYLGTHMGYTVDDLTQANIYRIEPVSVVHLAGQTSETRLCAVANGELWTSLSGGAFQEPGGTGSLTNPVLSTDTTNPDGYVSMAALNGHLFITDGRTMLDYDGRRDKVLAMRSKTAGELKPRARCIAAWRGRLIWYRFADSPYEYLMSAVGNPYDYDIAPPSAKANAAQAVLGSKAPRGTGQAPDIINALIPYSDDTLIFGCASSVWRLDGDPMDNGRFTRISESTGIAFGDSWCTDEAGNIYCMGTRGIIYAVAGSSLVPLSEEAIPDRLGSIDYSTTRVSLIWDSSEQGFHALLIPVDPTNATVVEHYFWSRKTKGWYPEQFASEDMQPTATFVGDGNLAANRRAVIGCADGFVRAFEATANDDDGTAILSRCLIGPIAPDDTPYEVDFRGLRGVLASAQGGCAYRMFATDTPDELGDPVASGTLDAGANDIHWSAHAVGSYVAIEVSNSSHETFALESLDFVDVTAAGQRTAR